jgi:hypothetical protein
LKRTISIPRLFATNTDQKLLTENATTRVRRFGNKMPLVNQQIKDQLELAAVVIALETAAERLSGKPIEKADVSAYIDPVVNWAREVDSDFAEGELHAIFLSHVMGRVKSILKEE